MDENSREGKTPPGKTCAIVGAAVSGLTAARWALAYGHEPVVFETSGEVGGLWCYKPQETEYASVMKSTVINTSKEMNAYSDFPPPAHFANFMHNTQMLRYLQMYTEHHNLYPHIRFHHHVVDVSRADDYAKSGRWVVKYRDPEGNLREELFDSVLVCTGHHALPNMPKPFPYQERFRGQIIHSHSYKDHVGYEDSVVVVVGIGNSGGDVASELSHVARETFLSTRRGAWVLTKIWHYGLPFDFYMNRRLVGYMRKLLPISWQVKIMENELNRKFDHALYGLRPKHSPFAQHPTANDELANRIISGMCKVKPNIRRFTEDGEGVEWEDGTVTQHVDHVIMATGYIFGFPILEGGNLLPIRNNEAHDLYKYMYPVELSSHNTLAVIGYFQPLGSILPVAEMQTRLFFSVLSGATRLPSADAMRRDIRVKREEMAKRYVKSTRHTIQVDYVDFMDELGDMIGCVCRPLWAFFFKSPRLAYQMIFGQVTAYQYRIRGPHSWAGALEASLTVDERVKRGAMSRDSGFKTCCDATPLLSGKSKLAIVLALTAICGYAGWPHVRDTELAQRAMQLAHDTLQCGRTKFDWPTTAH